MRYVPMQTPTIDRVPHMFTAADVALCRWAQTTSQSQTPGRGCYVSNGQMAHSVGRACAISQVPVNDRAISESCYIVRGRLTAHDAEIRHHDG